MSKVILFLSAVGMTVLLICGIFFPDSPIMWLASTTTAFTLLRAVVVAILIGLLVTTPPRNVYFRFIVGLVTVGIMGWVMRGTYTNSLEWMDSLSLMSASLAAFIVALERDWEERLAKLHTVLQPESSLRG